MRNNLSGGEQVSTDVGSAGNLLSLPCPMVRKNASLVLTGLDINTWLLMDVAGANTVTVPTEAEMPLPRFRSGLAQLDFQNGHSVLVTQMGNGLTTLVPGAGVTFLSTSGSFAFAARYARAALVRVAQNTWLVEGAFA